MYSKSIVILCELAALFSLLEAAPAKKNIEFKTCKRSDSLFLECFKTELQNVIPQLDGGYAKFRIPPIEPFDLPALDIAKGNGAVSVDISLQNIKIHGLTSAKIMSLDMDVDKLKLNAKISFKKPINLVGHYTAKGKVQVLPINGKGPCNITLVDPVLEITDVKANIVQKNGKNYINLEEVHLKVVHLQRATMKLDNLFRGNKELSDNLNVFINENWQLLYEELRPAFEEAIALIVKDIATKSLLKLTKEEIFPA